MPEDLESTKKESETETKLLWPILMAYCRERPYKWRLEEMASFLVGSRCGNAVHIQTVFPKAI